MHTTTQIPATRKHRRSESTEATEAGLAIRELSPEKLQQYSCLPGFSVVNHHDPSAREEDISFSSPNPVTGLSRSEGSAREQQARSKAQGEGLRPNHRQLHIAPVSIARKIRLCKRTAKPDGSEYYPSIGECSKESIVRGVAPSANPKVKLLRLHQKS